MLPHSEIMNNFEYISPGDEKNTHFLHCIQHIHMLTSHKQSPKIMQNRISKKKIGKKRECMFRIPF